MQIKQINCAKRLHSGALFFYYIIKVYVALGDNYY